MKDILPCVILPLQTKNILLPFAAIAEIILYEEPKSVTDMPDWLLGFLAWRGIDIPLTHLEKMESYFIWGRQDNNIMKEDKAHIAIINRMAQVKTSGPAQKASQYPFFSIVLKDTPKLHYISKNNIDMVTDPELEPSRFVMEVKVQNDNVFIPDLIKLWEIIDTLPTRLQWFRQIV